MPLDDNERKRLIACIPGIAFDTSNNPILPLEMTLDAIKNGVYTVNRSKQRDVNRDNFLMGNMILKGPIKKHGDRIALCRELFGEKQAKLWSEMAWCTQRWNWNQFVPWTWTHYKATAGAPLDIQQEYVNRNAIQPLTVEELKDECRKRKLVDKAVRENEKFSKNFSPLWQEDPDKESSSYSSRYIYVELFSGRYQIDCDSGDVLPIGDAGLLTSPQATLLSRVAVCLPGIPVADEEEE